MWTEEYITEELKRYNQMAQTVLYEKYARIFFGICLRYTNSRQEAEDILQEALIKIMTKVKLFTWRGEGSFFAWAKRVVINTAISHIKEQEKFRAGRYQDDLEIKDEDLDQSENELDKKDIDRDKIDYSIVSDAQLSQEELIEALKEVPEYFRIVFNLHVIEGIKHKQIAEMLEITEKTSKTRLFRARAHLQKIIYQKCIEKVGV